MTASYKTILKHLKNTAGMNRLKIALSTFIFRFEYNKVRKTCTVMLFVSFVFRANRSTEDNTFLMVKKKGKLHPCTGTEALYRPYGP